MKKEISDKIYIKELEKALIFMCECYVEAKDSIGCRELDGEADDRYTDIYFKFPMIQGTANIFAVKKIAELRTPLGNREGNEMSMNDIFEKMHLNRQTETEMREQINKAVKNNN